MFVSTFISERKECAILYAGTNQTGAVANIFEGEFEHASDSSNPVMPLGDDSESVYVYPGCSLTAYAKYQYQLLSNGDVNTGNFHTFQHDDGSQDMPENDNFAYVNLANLVSSYRCECS